MPLQSLNPATDEIVREYPETPPEEVSAVLTAAREAFGQWRRTSFAERAAPLRRAAELLRERREDLARLMALEMGKPLAQGRAEAEKCAWVCDHYAEGAEAFLAPEDIATDAQHSYVAFEPLGVVLAVMPWNFPLWQVFRFTAPALMAGNAGVLKHASNVSGCALALEAVLHDAGIPRDLFRTLLIGSSSVASVIEASEIAAVTLTGSTPAGRAVAEKAGACLKKVVLELGGSDPYVILEDADLDAAVATLVDGAMYNSGQCCCGIERIYVTSGLFDDFVEKAVAIVSDYKLGNPLDPETTLGPMAHKRFADEVRAQRDEAIAAGAVPMVDPGLFPEDDGGTYLAPQILTNVNHGMRVMRDESFGPVAGIMPVSSDEQAIERHHAMRIAANSISGWWR